MAEASPRSVADAVTTPAAKSPGRFIGFPETVNEVSARLVATGVVIMATTVVLGLRWMLIPLVYGFLARVLAGPRFSPLGRLVTGVIAPRLPFEGRTVTGAPKRFAQGVGLAFSSASAVAFLFGASTVGVVVISMLIAAATLEAAFGLCLGCVAYGQLQRWGVIADDTCVECANLDLRYSGTN